MRFLDETTTAALITEEMAYSAARAALVAATSGTSFPSVHGHGSDPANRFTVKSGASAELAGVKVGSFWPGNDALGLARHSSTILLFDQSVGRIEAVVEAARVNALRTAAADAVAADALARPDATTLGVFGTGNQALHECLALARIRPLSTVRVVGRSAERTEVFVDRLAAHGIDAEPASAQQACGSDIVVTATTAREPLFDADWVRPGTHLASMGSDSPGKQEMPVEIAHRARLFCDLPAQSRAIGEFQHVSGDIEAGRLTLTAIGDVLTGQASGRRSEDDITVFDSSGIALQDLYIAAALLAAHGS
ncbi:ornithine cyclodeaminase family protein [Actinokineospora bangkokensis]|uniref:Ornithine cyclodeaminase family protein n=1 Tax=Actinokineospora bangkokensis TaxID=1193682 RepID=A0A1Q9LMY2_9PSEU|nr:ornithine cyclodeaminase family protein [Actinokineospora bangkokensis]OLR93407.1 ornithine cyclodeaminase family protein [Actinokineospora bangkokensis]